MKVLGVLRFSTWLERAALALATATVAAIIAFYVVRMLVPLPIFAADAGAYLIRALYPDEMVVRNPYVTAITNGVHLSLIRAAFHVGSATGASYILIDKAVNGALYIAGLLGLWVVSVRGVAWRERIVLLLLALGFAYYRFPFDNMAEGPFVGVLALICVITWAWYRRWPILHALAAGVACAALVLAKPHGVATVAALAMVAVADAVFGGDWRRLPARLLVFAAAFFAAGNLIQMAAQEPVSNPTAFFMSDFYSGAVGQQAPAGAWRLGVEAFAIMACSALLLCGVPIVLGLSDLAERWRGQGGAFRLKDRDLVFLILLVSLAATIAMVAIFAMKVAGAPSETYRLWGRYYEFYAPMLWLAAAPTLTRASRRTTVLSGVLTLVALAGLLGFLQHGWIVLPWDSAVLTAFFQSDPIRAALALPLPIRGMAAAASLLAAGALCLRVNPAIVGCALLLTLSGLSTWLDQVWLSELARHRTALLRDLRAIGPALPHEPARVVLITPDANVGHLGFLELKAQPFVVVGDPQAPPPGALDGAAAIVASGDKAPAGAWAAAYRGPELSLWRAAASPEPLQPGG